MQRRKRSILLCCCSCTTVCGELGGGARYLDICRKLIPKHFTAANILGAQLSLALAATIAYAGFGPSNLCPSILVILSTGICAYFLVIRITRPWFMDLTFLWEGESHYMHRRILLFPLGDHLKHCARPPR